MAHAVEVAAPTVQLLTFNVPLPPLVCKKLVRTEAAQGPAGGDEMDRRTCWSTLPMQTTALLSSPRLEKLNLAGSRIGDSVLAELLPGIKTLTRLKAGISITRAPKPSPASLHCPASALLGGDLRPSSFSARSPKPPASSRPAFLLLSDTPSNPWVPSQPTRAQEARCRADTCPPHPTHQELFLTNCHLGDKSASAVATYLKGRSANAGAREWEITLRDYPMT